MRPSPPIPNARGQTGGSSDPSFEGLDQEDVERLVAESGLSDDKLYAAARLVYQWERGDEPDARVLVVRIAKLLECPGL